MTAIMQTADRATDTGNHHDPPITSHTADAATAEDANTATGRCGVRRKSVTLPLASDLSEGSTSHPGVAVVSDLLFIAIYACPSLHLSFLQAGTVTDPV